MKAPSSNAKRRSVLRDTVAALRSLVREVPEEAFLGHEGELAQRFQVSRPTFRQAARLLQYEQMIEVRRGSQGGLFGRRPDLDGLLRATALALHGRGSTMHDIFITSHALMSLACESAASRDPIARQSLIAAIDRLRPDAAHLSAAEFIQKDRMLTRTILSLCSIPTVTLFGSVLDQLGLSQVTPAMFEPFQPAGAQFQALRLQVAEAVLAGDVELAMLFQRRVGELVRANLENPPISLSGSSQNW